MKDYQDYIEFFEENSCGVLATVSNNKPKVRPWAFQFENIGKIWFMTTNNKRVYGELKANPYIEFCSLSRDFTSGRLSGKIEFLNDLSIKERILEERPILKTIYQTADNPILETFYLEHGSISLYSSRLEINDYFEF